MERFLAADVAFTRYNSERALRPEDGALERRRFGRAVAVRDLGRADGYYNRVIGLSEDGLPRLEEICAWFLEAGRACEVTLTPERASARLVAALEERGFRLRGKDAYMAARCTAFEAPSSELRIRRAVREDLDAVFDLWGEPSSPPVPPEVRARRSEAHLTSEFLIYLGFQGQQPVAMATTFLGEGLAWLGNANTLASHRRLGYQLALFQHRLWDARERDCGWALSDMEPGSASQRNAERAGMELAFQTSTLVLESE